MTDILEEMYIELARKAQESWEKDTQAVDLFNNHIMQVAALSCARDFQNYDHDERVACTRMILGKLLIAMYAVRLMPPSDDDLKDMAEAMNSNVANDSLLCAALVCRGANDAFLFFHEEDQEVSRDLIRSVGEALSGVYLLCSLLGIELDKDTPVL